MRVWRPMEAMDFKLLKSFMERMLRDVRRSRDQSSVKEITSGNGPLITILSRDVSVWRPRANRGLLTLFLPFAKANILRFGVENTSKEEDITSGQLHRARLRREVRFCNIFPGIDSSWLQSQMWSVSSVEGKSPLGMDLREEHSHTFRHSRQEVWCIIPSGRDSSFSQSSIINVFRVAGSSPLGKPIRDEQYVISKYSRARLLIIIPSGSVSRPSQFCTQKFLSMGGKPVSGNDTSLGQFPIRILVRDVRGCNAFGSFSKLEHFCVYISVFISFFILVVEFEVWLIGKKIRKKRKQVEFYNCFWKTVFKKSDILLNKNLFENLKIFLPYF